MVKYLKRLKSSKFVRVKAFPMYGGIGVSAPSLHRESTDSLMSAPSLHRESTDSLIYTSVKIIKNEVGCRDDTMPKTVVTRRHCKVWLRACNNCLQPPKTEM